MYAMDENISEHNARIAQEIHYLNQSMTWVKRVLLRILQGETTLATSDQIAALNAGILDLTNTVQTVGADVISVAKSIEDQLNVAKAAGNTSDIDLSGQIAKLKTLGAGITSLDAQINAIAKPVLVTAVTEVPPSVPAQSNPVVVPVEATTAPQAPTATGSSAVSESTAPAATTPSVTPAA
jgi:hypothetical protein